MAGEGSRPGWETVAKAAALESAHEVSLQRTAKGFELHVDGLMVEVLPDAWEDGDWRSYRRLFVEVQRAFAARLGIELHGIAWAETEDGRVIGRFFQQVTRDPVPDPPPWPKGTRRPLP